MPEVASLRTTCVPILVTVAVALTACSGTTKQTPGPPQYSSVMAHVPADTPYTLAVGSLQLSDAALERELRKLQRQKGIAQLFRGRLEALLGIDIFDPDALRETGLDLRGDFAIFGVGTRPAFLVRVRDETRFNRFREEVRTHNPRLVFGSRRIDGRTVESVQLGESRISYSTTDDGYVVGVYHDASQPVDEMMRQVFALSGTEGGDLGHAERLGTVLDALGGERDWDSILYVDTASLDTALLERAAPERDPILGMIEGPRREQVLESVESFHARCAERGEALAQQLPWVAAGMVLDESKSEQRIVVPMAETLHAAVSDVFPALDEGPSDAVSEAIVAAAIAIDFEALSRVTNERRELSRCPNLAALEGAAAILGSGFGATDAADVFAGPMQAMLFDFDLALWGSKRSGALIFEARDLEAMRTGFDLYMQGLQAMTYGTDDDGVSRYAIMGGLLEVSVIDVGEQHLALAVGDVDVSTLEAAARAAAESAPPDDDATGGDADDRDGRADSTPSDERAGSDDRGDEGGVSAQTGLRAWLRVDGERLQQVLGVVTAAQGTDDTVMGSIALVVQDLKEAEWKVRMSTNGMILEGAWRRSSESETSGDSP